MINFFRAIVLSLLLMGAAHAQPAGQLQAGQTWGNPGASKALASPTTIGALLDQEYTCTARGSIVFRGSALWTCLAPGSSGQPLTSQGAGADLHFSTITGTGNFVLSASPTLTGTIGAAAMTLSTPLNLASGGTNSSLTASAGGIPWSDGSKLNILAGTATPGLCLQSGNLATPAWASCSGGAAVSGVTNSDGTLTISPTTGAVVASIALSHANTWSGAQSFNNNDLKLNGSSSGALTVNAPAAAGSNTLTLPAGTTDFSATGGANQFVKQSSAGAALTVAAITDADLPAVNTATLALASPVSTTNATGVMMGLGVPGQCVLTPLIGSRIMVTIDGLIQNGTSGQTSAIVGLRFGTGTAPINAAALSGTVLGQNPRASFKAAASPGLAPFSVSGIATGLTPGVAVWFDVGLSATSASTAAIASLTCTLEELR